MGARMESVQCVQGQSYKYTVLYHIFLVSVILNYRKKYLFLQFVD